MLLVALIAAAIGAGARTPAARAFGEGEASTEFATAATAPAGPTPDPLAAVDKQRALPIDSEPDDLVSLEPRLMAPGFGGLQLRADAARALETLLAEAQRAGHDVRVRSAYRSYETQVQTYAYWVSQLGAAQASRVSAAPGHSEHQLGTTVDLTVSEVGWELSERLDLLPVGRWLLRNAWRHGFALSYPREAEAITGYVHEPWHYRYIGTAEARRWAESGLTLGEYLQQRGRRAGVPSDRPSTSQ
jgi:D-alanyl-D-alanine carboxypeptidase